MGIPDAGQFGRFTIRRTLNVGVFAVVFAAVVLVWWSALHTILSDVTPPPSVGQPRSLAWGDRVFTNRAQLRNWLEQRGIDYDAWTRRHASAAAIVEHKRVPSASVAHKVTEATARAHPKTGKKPAVGSTRGEQSSHAQSHLFTYLTWMLVALLAGAAMAPRHWYARLQYQAAGAVRLYAGVAACAVTLGSLVARI